jgi:Zn-dependent peptidase ImmA (M78 family)/DNA-binding XRE family transcriptional regulator
VSESTSVGEDAAATAALLYEPHRLRVARSLRGLAQSDLAEACGVRKQAVSQWEADNGTRPTAANLTTLSVRLGVPVSFFGTAQPDPDPGMFFRSLRSTTATDRRRASAMAHLAHLLAVALEEEVELPAWNAPRLAAPSTTDIPGIDRAAEELREILEVPPGPAGNVVAGIERQGAVVVRADRVAPTISAFSVPYPQRPVVVLGGDGNEHARARMDAVHEFVHLVMHDPDPTHPTAIEKQATAIASAFLLPRYGFADEVEPLVRGTRIDWKGLVALRARWGASIQAMLYRAKTLRVMPETRYTQAMKFMSMKGWRKTEPGSLRLQEHAVLLARAVRLAAERGANLQDIADRNGFPVSDLQSLLVPERPIVHI